MKNHFDDRRMSKLGFSARLFLAFMLLPATASAESGHPASTPSFRAPVVVGTIVGRVVDDVTGEPIVSAQVRIREVGRSDLSHADGSFHFLDVAARGYTILAQRIGYAPVETRVAVVDGQTLTIELRMTPSALE